MKLLRGLQTLVLALLCAAGTASVVACALWFTVDLTPSIVMSGSMEPTLPVGSLVFTQTVDAADVAVGDIVMVPQHGGDGVVTHRVVDLAPADAGRVTLTLRGDANPASDVGPYTVRAVDKHRFTLPYLGKALVWAQDHRLAAGLGLLVLLALTFIGRGQTKVRLPNGEVIRGLSRREAERLAAAWQASDEPRPEGRAHRPGGRAPWLRSEERATATGPDTVAAPHITDTVAAPHTTDTVAAPDTTPPHAPAIRPDGTVPVGRCRLRVTPAPAPARRAPRRALAPELEDTYPRLTRVTPDPEPTPTATWEPPTQANTRASHIPNRARHALAPELDPALSRTWTPLPN
ncbi:MAG: signal peptidase I [Propionibacteriaceae bacterium]|nr:signal peptidase I [Propionibacteriaceae bacterium]